MAMARAQAGHPAWLDVLNKSKGVESDGEGLLEDQILHNSSQSNVAPVSTPYQTTNQMRRFHIKSHVGLVLAMDLMQAAGRIRNEMLQDFVQRVIQASHWPHRVAYCILLPRTRGEAGRQTN